MGFIFSDYSKERLQTCHPDLQLIAKEAIACTPMDFRIIEGRRTRKRQNELYQQGYSKIDGYAVKGKHNYHPSQAFDIVAIVNGKVSWLPSDLTFLAGIILGIGAKLLQEDKVSHKLRWGGNWDGDGIIIRDQSFIDLPHFELVGVK